MSLIQIDYLRTGIHPQFAPISIANPTSVLILEFLDTSKIQPTGIDKDFYAHI